MREIEVLMLEEEEEVGGWVGEEGTYPTILLRERSTPAHAAEAREEVQAKALNLPQPVGGWRRRRWFV